MQDVNTVLSYMYLHVLSSQRNKKFGQNNETSNKTYKVMSLINLCFTKCKISVWDTLYLQVLISVGKSRVLLLDVNHTFLLYCRYTSNSDYLTTDDLLLFLEAEQGVMFRTHCPQRKNSLGKHSEFICKKRR